MFSGEAEATPYAVASYIVAAYWFTVRRRSNPAVRLHAACRIRLGIRPLNVHGSLLHRSLGHWQQRFVSLIATQELLPETKTTGSVVIFLAEIPHVVIAR